MRRRKLALATLLLTIGAIALVFAGASSGHTKASSPFKVAFIYVGPHNDGGWSQAHDDGPAVRPEDARQQGPDDVQGEHRGRDAVQPDRREPLRPGLQDDLRDLVRLLITKALAAKYPNILFEQATGTDVSKNLAEYFGRGRGHDLPLRHGRGLREPDGQARRRPRVPDPRSGPARERVRARRPVRAPRRDRPGRVDALLVQPGRREEGGAGPRLSGRGRARPERRLPCNRPVRRDAEPSVGRLRQRRVEVRAQVVADRVGLQLGPLLPEARQGSDGRHVEAGLLLRHDQRRLHEARPVRAGRHGGRRRRRSPRSRRRSRTARSTSSPVRSTTRAASCALQRASRWTSSRAARTASTA